MPKASDSISLRGVRTNNLKGLDVDIPIGAFSVVTGVSGSGKSSLVFDTLYGEAYRRYVESLSSFARQYLKALPKPDIESIKNLPPAIAVRQTRSGSTSRSTVATMTEILDLLRIIYAGSGVVVCHGCEKELFKANPDRVLSYLKKHHVDARVLITAPLAALKVTVRELKPALLEQGFTRACTLQGEVSLIEQLKPSELKKMAVVIDRCKVTKDHHARLLQACRTALKLGAGHLCAIVDGRAYHFLDHLSCFECSLSYREPTPALLSFNHPLGACHVCQGFGYEATLDWQKIIPDEDLSLAEQGVAAWNFGSHTDMYDAARRSAKRSKVPVRKPFSEYSSHDWQWLREGDGGSFTGISGYFDWLNSKRHKAHYRIHAARFRKYELCSGCLGLRLNHQALAVKVGGRHLGDVCQLSVDEFQGWLACFSKNDVTRNDYQGHGLEEALEEAQARVAYLMQVGLSYLTLDRQTRTLSGGELQRIHMARCLGSALTDTLYCLDEPSSGLHPRDSNRLLQVVKSLRDQGNTVVVVEHERHIIDGADHLIEIGPEAGHLGGELVYAGRPYKIKQREYAKSTRLAVNSTMASKQPYIEVKGVRTHNLKNIDVKFPLGKLTVVCGVSGSGKTSLIQHSLYPSLAKALGQNKLDGYLSESSVASIGPKRSLGLLSQVIHVSQTSIGRSTRSSIVTYLGVFDEIRRRFAMEPAAKAQGLAAGAFSFNSPGGRCETCQGIGTVIEDLSFLGEMAVVCPSCLGARFQQHVLEVRYRGKNLNEILAMTVSQAREFFHDVSTLSAQLASVEDMGLGYLTLGQNTSSFSGGEAQRLKLLRLLKTATTSEQKPSVLIFDEPTTGLSDWDVTNLIEQFRSLTNRGHSVIVVEHHLAMMRAADWLIEIGPDAAQHGGALVYQGEPQGISAATDSHTASYLWPTKSVAKAPRARVRLGEKST